MSVPAYESILARYHHAFQKELQKMLEDLPICADDKVLDVGCGDGFYSCALAPLVAPRGHVVGIDLLPSYLKIARRHAEKNPYSQRIHFMKADIQKLPFHDDSFDLAWCAQSLISLPDPLQTLQEMRRVVKPGGVVAVLENDTLHQLLLPWTFEDELLLRRAQWKASQKDHGSDRERLYIGRQLSRLFAEAGIRPQRRRTYASHREYPVGLKEKHFLDAYLMDLRDSATPFLFTKDRARLRSMLTPGSPSYLVDESHFSVTCLDHVLWGKKAERKILHTIQELKSDIIKE